MESRVIFKSKYANKKTNKQINKTTCFAGKQESRISNPINAQFVDKNVANSNRKQETPYTYTLYDPYTLQQQL